MSLVGKAYAEEVLHGKVSGYGGGVADLQPLKFTGAVNATYDGKQPVEVKIPEEAKITEAEKEEIIREVKEELITEVRTEVIHEVKTEVKEEVKEEVKAEVKEEVVEEIGGELTNIDFSGFDDGSYTEVVDGEEVTHVVTFDDSGRPVTIDGTSIEWGDVGTEPEEPEEPADPSAPVESTEYPGCYYRDADGENEWINPPMIPGEFYRTQERHNGNPVYVACVQHKKATGSNSTTMVYQGKLVLMAYPHIISLSGVVSNSYGEAYPSYKYGELKTWYDEGELCVDYNVTMAMPESTVDIIVKYTLD